MSCSRRVTVVNRRSSTGWVAWEIRPRRSRGGANGLHPSGPHRQTISKSNREWHSPMALVLPPRNHRAWIRKVRLVIRTGHSTRTFRWRRQGGVRHMTVQAVGQSATVGAALIHIRAGGQPSYSQGRHRGRRKAREANQVGSREPRTDRAPKKSAPVYPIWAAALRPPGYCRTPSRSRLHFRSPSRLNPQHPPQHLPDRPVSPTRDQRHRPDSAPPRLIRVHVEGPEIIPRVEDPGGPGGGDGVAVGVHLR